MNKQPTTVTADKTSGGSLGGGSSAGAGKLRTLSWILALAAFAVFPAFNAKACVSCNIHFGEQILDERADSLIGRDIRQAMANQHGMKLDEMTEVSPELRVKLEQAAISSLSGVAVEPSTEAAPVEESADDANAAEDDAAASPVRPEEDECCNTGSAPSPMPTAFDTLGAAPNPTFNRLSERFPELYEGHDFIEIIKRDEGLSIPTTSYVPQDIEPDVQFTIELSEGLVYLGNGVIYEGFVTNGKIPGPTLRATQGDIIEFTVVNKGTVPHGASIHAANTQTSKYVGQIPPGESKSVKFRATQPGVFMYHCAPGGHAIPMHVQFGQYGMMVIEPAEKKYRLEEELGHEPDVTLHIVQHGIYASGRDAVEGSPLYTMFNGKIFRYVEEPIMAQPGDYVRIYFLNVGPNELSTFHFVGIVWDYVYWQGHPDAVMPGGQTVTAGPSDSWVIEFRVPPDEGAYTMLTHGVGEASRGTIGLLVADRDAETPVTILADGPKHTQEELEEMKEGATRVISPYRPADGPGDEPVVYGRDTDQVYVRILGNSYSPKVVQVTPGTTVTWINEDVFSYLAGEFSGIHNVVSVGEPPERFVSQMMAHGEEFSFTFELEGEYDYICTPHPYMEGRVIVKEEPLPDLEGVIGATGRGLAGLALVLAVLAVVVSLAGIARKR